MNNIFAKGCTHPLTSEPNLDRNGACGFANMQRVSVHVISAIGFITFAYLSRLFGAILANPIKPPRHVLSSF